MTALEEAQRLAGWGFNVLPASRGEKSPIVSWRKYQNIRTDDKLPSWFGGSERNYWINTGRISQLVVVDCDSPEAEAYWYDILTPVEDGVPHPLDTTAAVKTAKGTHYYFRQAHADPIPSWSHHDKETGISFDVRAEGTGVIAPPSLHHSGMAYEWLREPELMLDAPDYVLSATRHPNLRKPGSDPEAGGARSMLSQLLNNPPSEGGRNDWLARVAGHYAKQYRGMPDAYETHIRMAVALMDPPLPEAEWRKTADSIMRSENEKWADSNPDDKNGHLVTSGYILMTPCRVKRGENYDIEMYRWSNFSIRAEGVVETAHGDRIYDVAIRLEDEEHETSHLLPAKVLADPKALNVWLANRGCVIATPPHQQISRARESARLQLFLDSHKPDRFIAVDCLGWHGEDFICHQGVIRADGLHPFDGVKPAPHLRTRATHEYGFVGQEIARETLREVLTFHDETVAAVFGAWWAASLLKPMIAQRFSQFPIGALEAASESGKTTGMFAMLMQLAGSTEGQGLATRAAMQRALADHNSCPVWMDDANDLEHVDELLRAVTGDGFARKMAEDRMNTVVEELVAPVLLSGEALGKSDQKAMADRRVTLRVPSPVGRMSLKDPSKPQWDDIRELRAKYPDGLHVMAGDIIAMAAAAVDELDKVSPGSSGKRNVHKLTVLAIGGRVLSRMTGEDKWSQIVNDWIRDSAEANAESYNTLVETLIPTALMVHGMPDWPQPGGINTGPTPAYVKDGLVHFQAKALAEWWSRYRYNRVDQRTETTKAIRLQRDALEGVGRVQVRPGKARGGSKVWYDVLPAHLSQYVIGLAEGYEAVPSLDARHALEGPKDRSGEASRLPADLIRYMESEVE